MKTWDRFVGLKGNKAFRVNKDLKDPKVHRGIVDRKAHKGPRVTQVLLESRDLRARRVIKVILENRALKVLRDLKDLRVILVTPSRFWVPSTTLQSFLKWE